MPEGLLTANPRPARLLPATTAIELIGRSPAISRVQELVRRAASVEGAVLLVAEAGVDVESVARDLHHRSRPAQAPWVAVNCEGDGQQLETRLFGTSLSVTADLESIASDSLLALARGGTLFLGNVTELPSGLQTRLARVVRDGEVRVGGQAIATELRVLAGAPPSIDADLHQRRFRSDLYRRLAVTRIDLPPLRDRPGDVPAFVERVLLEASTALDARPRTFTHAATALLSALTWPGNLSELRAAIERVLAQSRDDVIQVEQVLPALHLERSLSPFIPVGNLREARMRFEREYIAAVLQHHNWRMGDAAKTLGIQRPNLYRKARQLGIPVARTTE